MKRILSIVAICSILFLAYSCVTPDPVPTPSTVNNISGPRILTKIDSSSVTLSEFISSDAGILLKVKKKNNKVQDVYYNSDNKIFKILFDQTNPAHTNLTLAYDTSGKVIAANQENYVNNLFSTAMQATLTYNTANKLSHIEKKYYTQTSTSWTSYTVVDITYSGENVTQIVQNSGNVVNNVNQPLNPANAITYQFSNFDNKINPYNTLSKDYNVGMGILNSIDFVNLSYNNAMKITKQIGAGTPAITNQVTGYSYDPQNYPISDSQGIKKFYYKALQ